MIISQIELNKKAEWKWNLDVLIYY
jgi:hypothetical protein